MRYKIKLLIVVEKQVISKSFKKLEGKQKETLKKQVRKQEEQKKKEGDKERKIKSG